MKILSFQFEHFDGSHGSGVVDAAGAVVAVIVSGNYICLEDDNRGSPGGLRIVAISNPLMPAEVRVWITLGARGIYFSMEVLPIWGG